jgi:hypothetical protein
VSAAPDVYVGPAFVGWRSWRILPFERLGEPESVRLCASGTRGIPKVWEPGQATRALCGKFKTTHEAPWPGCECGVYAYRTREAAEAHLESFRVGNKEGVLGWAFGQVSLWGRIVECEHGWRSEQAYPYAIEVHAEPHVAALVRRLYGVDVEEHPPFPPIEPAEEKPDARTEARQLLGQLQTELTQVKANLAEINAATPLRVRAKPRPIESLRDVLNYDLETGKFRGEYDRLCFVERSFPCDWKGPKPITSRGLARRIMQEAGKPAYIPNASEVSELGVDLYRLAMRLEVHRLRAPRTSVRYWSQFLCDGFEEDDPTLEHLERDVPLVTAIVAAGDGEAVAVKQAMAQLSAGIRPERSQLWSQAFVRCSQRGWIAEVRGKRQTWKPTWRGLTVARLGGPPLRLDAYDLSSLLAALRSAVAEEGGPVTVDALNWRFDGTRHPPGGHSLAQKLMSLERRGQVRRRRQPNAKLVLWEPVTMEATDAAMRRGSSAV